MSQRAYFLPVETNKSRDWVASISVTHARYTTPSVSQSHISSSLCDIFLRTVKSSNSLASHKKLFAVRQECCILTSIVVIVNYEDIMYISRGDTQRIFIGIFSAGNTNKEKNPFHRNIPNGTPSRQG